MKIFPVYYFPPVSWFVAAAQEKEIWLETKEFYKKQQYFNRMRILASNKILLLSIPVSKAKEHTSISERKISYAVNWQRNHWISLTSAYRSSPYFEFYEDRLEPFFKEPTESLLEHNLEIIRTLQSMLQLDFKIHLTESFQPSEAYSTDYRAIFHHRGPTQAPWFDPQPYLHVFGNEFHPDLSVLDLLCNQGPASSLNLMQSYRSS